MSRSVRLSFVLIEVTQYGRDSLGNINCQITSTFGISTNSNLFPLIPGNDLPCVNGSLTSLTEPTRVSPVPRATQVSQGLVVSSLFVRHAFFGFLSIIEQISSGSCACFVSVNFIHIAFGFSGYHDVSYLSRFDKLMESPLRLHLCQEFSQYEPLGSVLELCLLWNSSQMAWLVGRLGNNKVNCTEV